MKHLARVHAGIFFFFFILIFLTISFFEEMGEAVEYPEGEQVAIDGGPFSPKWQCGMLRLNM